ncbi:FAD-dependent oxidoreductase [Microbulbifer yueqingensis]|uniref:Nitrite reductase (NADH) large subunit n=1 Tax=Microbulbifer yueqingensis TaxID=658219 RepID=A0A1G8VEC0_9GAMM|nr:FAD-dependent oxidoreductase [Microbulbifer yueqingensis]SDJ63675.1 nitrite reductase (NADH) large subunit [Microbulbifer yueqingensis]
MTGLLAEPRESGLHAIQAVADPDYPIYVVIGAGPVGVRCAQKLLEYSTEAQVVVIGAEDEAPYNRVRLSQYLSEEVSREELDNPVRTEPHPRLAEFTNCRIVRIDRASRRVYDQHGNAQPYTKLILATGSRPAIPDIPGIRLGRILPFRSLGDARTLLELRQSSRCICVIGAGALGLEAAAALKTRNNRVVLHSRAGLLGGRLSREAESYLTDALEALQIELRSGVEVSAFHGPDRVRQVEFSDGNRLEADAVVLCTGIAPETGLAEACGLDRGRGILVSPQMQTSDPDIYAVGECAEFEQKVYQLVRPGYQQAEVCSRHICAPASRQESDERYAGSHTDIELKISHIPCVILGEETVGTGPETRRYTYRNRFRGLFRELVVRNGTIVAATSIGTWGEINRVRQTIATNDRISARRLAKFEESGELWQEGASPGIKEQPASYLVCQCNGVTKGELCGAISSGKRTLQELQLATDAGSVCGSCRPLIAELLDTPAPNLVMRHARGILVTSILSLALIAIAVLLPPTPVAESVQAHWYWEKIWYDNFWKQVSGYTLLVLCLLTASLSLRKRWQRLKAGHVDHWRYVHSVIGLLALLVLVVHTGFRLGENLNLALMLVFLAATTTGALVGVFMARNHHWTDMKLREHRKWWSRVHYALLWALPVLLFYHVLAVYYF